MKGEFPEADQRSAPLDVVVFIAAVVLGLISYVALRAWLNQEAQRPITITLVVIMFAYCAIVVRVARVRVRMDQAGDNAYYIGLLFTLGSMAFALYDFQLATQGSRGTAGVQQIISNFGIALATTVVGIFLRVALHQMRVDPADLEAVTRVELTEAAERLRGTLDTTTSDLARFHLELQQRQSDVMAEMAGRVSETAAAMQKTVAEASVRVVGQTEDSYKTLLAGTHQLTLGLKSLAEEATAAIERLRSVKAPPVTLSKRLEQFADVMERVASESERTTTALQATAGETAKAIASVKDTAESLKALTTQMRSEHVEITTKVGKAADSLTDGLEPFSSRLKGILADVTQLQDQLKESATESLRAQRATTDVMSSLTMIAREITSVFQSAGSHGRT